MKDLRLWLAQNYGALLALALFVLMFAIYIGNHAAGLTVPVVAVNRLAGQYFVFVAESMEQGFVARQKPITVGEVLGDDYVIRGGLMPGERVIVSNIQKIFDGAPVKPS